jgi:flagellar basal body-associated protein FliL
MIPSNKVVEPDFEGEEMKMPVIGNNLPNVQTAASSTLTIPIIILLFLILVAILGGLYYWYKVVTTPVAALPDTTRPSAAQNNEPESTTAEARTQTQGVVSTSDELSAIRADLDSTNLTDLDTEVVPIKAEMNAALKAQ